MRLDRVGSIALVCTLLLSACQSGEQSEEQDTDEEETLPVPVETSTPVRGNIHASYSGTAPIEAFAEADVVAKVDGEIRALLVEEGDFVEANQVLVRLDGDRLRLELNESRARLSKLQSDHTRNQELQNKGLLSEGDFEKIRYDLEALQASYNLRSLELDYTQVRSPINGVVSERYIKLGGTVKNGDPVFRVTSLDPLVAYLHVPEREYRRIEAGQPVLINVDALPGAPVAAKVTRVSPVIDPATGTFKITIEIRDENSGDRPGRIKPGMFGRMNIVYDTHENVLQVPRSAIIDTAAGSYVFVVEDGSGIRKSIETSFSAEGMVEVTTGLSDDDAVITVGHVGLKNDAKVTVINGPADAPVDETTVEVETNEASE